MILYTIAAIQTPKGQRFAWISHDLDTGEIKPKGLLFHTFEESEKSRPLGGVMLTRQVGEAAWVSDIPGKLDTGAKAP